MAFSIRSVQAPAAKAVLLLVLMTMVVRGDVASDEAQCSEQLVGMATCLPYAQGQSPSPTPDCCTGLKQVLAKSPKCLCVLIKDRNDPQLGLNLNLTRALRLPSVCNTPANISRCPELLNLPPNSIEAQIFKQFGNNSTAAQASPPTASTTSGNSSSSSTGNSSNNSTTPTSASTRIGDYIRDVKMVGAAAAAFLLLLVVP